MAWADDGSDGTGKELERDCPAVALRASEGAKWEISLVATTCSCESMAALVYAGLTLLKGLGAFHLCITQTRGIGVAVGLDLVLVTTR